MKTLLVSVLLVPFAIVNNSRAQTVRYVDQNATGSVHNGSTWCKAYVYLQDALAAAAGRTVEEIRVAGGVYRPDRDAANPDGTGDREATFQLVNGVTVKGGYAGCGAPDPDERDIDLYETVLSGDLAGNDDPVEFPGGASFEDNSCHVVTGESIDATTVLDGFTLAAGNAEQGCSSHSGAGMFNRGSPAVTSCTFIGNYGGGFHSRRHLVPASPVLSACTFVGNHASGVSIRDSSAATLVGCVFRENAGDSSGGGILINTSEPVILIPR